MTKELMHPFRRWMQRNNLSMQELSKILGCDTATLRSIFNGKCVEQDLARQVYFITDGIFKPPIKDMNIPTR